MRVAIALTALVVIDSVRFADPDLFVTLYAGREIAATSGPPRVDAASFTMAGKPWNDYEWLSRLLFFETAERADDRGLVVLRLALIAVVLATIAVVSFRSGGGLVSLTVTTLLFTRASGEYFLFRPTLFTFACLALLLAAIDRLARGDRWPAVAIPLAVPVWTNLHAGFALGIVLLFLLAAAGIAERLVPVLARVFSPGVPWTRSLPCALAAAAMTGLHPLGFRVWGAVAGTIGGRFTPSLSEWRPLLVSGIGQAWPVLLSMLVTAAAIVVGRRRLTTFDALSVLVLAAAAVERVRFVPLYAIAAALVSARALPALKTTSVFRRLEALAAARADASRLTGAGLAAAALAIALYRFGVFDLRIRKVPVLTPVAAVKFLEANGIGGRVLAEYDWGGYVRWKLPKATIFVDGRSDTVYPLPVIEEWARFVNAIGDWRQTPDRYGVDVVLLHADQAVVPLLEHDSGWVPAYADPFARVLLRDRPENAAAIEALRAGRSVVPELGLSDYLGL